jgi:hypothetical protein
MAGITLDQAQTKLSEWMAADSAVASGQAYEIHGRKMTRANAAEIQSNITYWNSWVVRLSRTGMRIRNGVPR